MVNVATWWVSLLFMALAMGVAVKLAMELDRMKDRNRTLRKDLRDAEDEILQLRGMLSMKPPSPAQPRQEEKPSPSEKQIKQAIRELQKWVKEDGGR